MNEPDRQLGQLPRVGLVIPQWDRELSTIVDSALDAERHGLDIWLAAQLYPISSNHEKSSHEPFALMGAVAQATTASRLGLLVYPTPFVPRIYLAKALVTLDHISGGRLEAGLGTGWRPEEFAALDVPFGTFSERFGLLEATIRALDAVAAQDPALAPELGLGERVPLPAPGALQRPRPPVWLGGQGPRMLDLMGRRADWANFARGISVAEFEEKSQRVLDAARAAGRPAGAVRLSIAGTFLGADALERRARDRGLDVESYRASLRATNSFVGTPDEIAEQLIPYVRAGCEAIALWPTDGDATGAAMTLSAVGRHLGEAAVAA